MSKLDQLQQMMKLLNDGISRQDFLDNFKIILDFVKQLKTNNEQAIKDLQNRYDGIVAEIKQNYFQDMADVKKKTLDHVLTQTSKQHQTQNEQIQQIQDKVGGLGSELTPTIALEASKLTLEGLKPLIPTIEAIENDLPKLGEKIVDGINLLSTDNEVDKIAIEHIRGLRDELDKLEKRTLGSTSHVMGGGGVGKTNVYFYDASSQLNGVLKTFSLPSFLRIIDVKLSSAPVLRPTVDWTSDASAHTLTFTSTIDADPLLLAGQSLMILYAI